MKKNWLGCLALLAVLFQSARASAEFIVSHRSPYAPGDKHHSYSTELLRLALEKTRAEYGEFKMQPIPPRNYARALKAAVDDAYPNLLIETSYEKALTHQAKLDFINFPIDLGVLGYRVCFINPKLKASGKKIGKLEDLRHYSFAHGVGWADTIIFRHNGLAVQEIDNYDGIFLMVIGGRVDFFCRGVNEILGEIAQFSHLKELTFDEQFLLVYPLPRFFYLNAKNKLAKERIDVGLRRAYADGSLQALWKTHFLPSLDLVKLTNRKIIKLENPLLDGLDVTFTQGFMPLLDEAGAKQP
ncbi:MAG TPA: hypothetical protein VLC79_17770 [Cellvibrio sp.]|nr:hypothetical protein [Cellvibrio sp.]